MPEHDGSAGALFTEDPFAPARRAEQFLRLAIDGPSGSGKTFTGLVAATTLSEWERARGNPGKIAVIDTEHGSAALFANEFTFNHKNLEAPFSPGRYINLMAAAADYGYDILQIDSLSHGWFAEGGVLDIVDNARARFGGNSFAGWKEGTPAQNALIQAIIAYPGHVICTMRSTQEWILEEGRNGTKSPKRVGMKPVQRDGVEYEFTFVLDIDLSHTAVVSKARSRAIADRVVQQPGPRFFEEIVGWLGSGIPMETPKQRERITELRAALDDAAKESVRLFMADRRLRLNQLSRDEADELIRFCGAANPTAEDLPPPAAKAEPPPPAETTPPAPEVTDPPTPNGRRGDRTRAASST